MREESRADSGRGSKTKERLERMPAADRMYPSNPVSSFGSAFLNSLYAPGLNG